MFEQSTSTTTTSFGKRMWHAILAMFLGPVFLCGAAVLIFWNEGHAIKVANSLREGAAMVIEANAADVDPSLDGRLVHLSRDVRPEGTLRDPEFGVKTSGVRLNRKVEIFEWEEKRRSERHGGSTTEFYSYGTDWKDQLISSTSFHDKTGHENPVRMAYAEVSYEAPVVRMGAYQLDPALVAKITDQEPMNLTAGDVQLPKGAQLLGDGRIYVGHDPQAPQVGDLRITERLVPAGAASVVAAVKGGRLVPYHARGGSDVGLVRKGSVDAATMFMAAQSSNQTLAWVLRGLGLLGLFIGLQCILVPLATLASWVPLLGGLFEGGVGVISLLGAGAVWSVLVAVSWLAARPLLGTGLIAAAALLVSKLFRRRSLPGAAKAA